MRFHISRARLVAVGFLAGVAPIRVTAQDPPFEGVVTFRMDESGKGKDVVQARQYIGKDAVRIEMTRRGQKPHIMIINRRQKQMIMPVPDQQMYMVLPISDLSSEQREAEARLQITKTGKTETIAGYRCEHWLVKDKAGDSYDTCVTRELGGFMATEGPAAGGQSRSASYAGLFRTDGVFPLRISEVGGGTAFEVTQVEKKSLDASLFEAPAGYRKMEMPGMGGRKP